MNKVSVGEAFAAGFRLIGRKPLVPLVWGAVHLVLFGIPVGVASVFLMRGVQQSVTNPFAGGGNFLVLMLVEAIFGLLAYSVINAAIYRAVLEPQNDANFYLAFGPQEGRQALVIATMIGVVLLAGLGLGLVMVIVAVAARAAGVVGMLLTLVAYLALIVAIGVIMLRLSLGGPRTFTKRRFALFESWEMTRGNSWRLLGIGFLLFLILLAIYSVLIGIFIATSGGTAGLMAMAAQQQQQLSTPAGLVKTAVTTVVGSALVGYFLAIFTAPWVDAFRQLSGHGLAEVFSDNPGPAPSVMSF